MKKNLKLNKVHISSMIAILTQLFEEGADYIDIEGEDNGSEESDVIKVIVKPEYYTNEEEINPLSEDDINDLI